MWWPRYPVCLCAAVTPAVPERVSEHIGLHPPVSTGAALQQRVSVQERVVQWCECRSVWCIVRECMGANPWGSWAGDWVHTRVNMWVCGVFRRGWGEQPPEPCSGCTRALLREASESPGRGIRQAAAS